MESRGCTGTRNIIFTCHREKFVLSATTQGHIQGLKQYPLLLGHVSCKNWKTVTSFTQAVSTSTGPFYHISHSCYCRARLQTKEVILPLMLAEVADSKIFLEQQKEKIKHHMQLDITQCFPNQGKSRKLERDKDDIPWSRERSFKQQSLCGRSRSKKSWGALVKGQSEGVFATQTHCPHSRTSLCLSVSPLPMFSALRL